MKEFNVVNKVLFSFILFTLIFIGGVSAVGTRPNLNSNMILYYYNDSFDKTTNNFHGSNVGGLYYNNSEGYFSEGAYTFYNNGSYINTTLSLNSTQNYSICYSVKFNSLSTENYQIVNRDPINKFMSYLSSNRLYFTYWNSTNSYNSYMSDTISIGTYYFVCMSFNKTNAYFYINGDYYSSINLNNINDANVPIKIAYSFGGSNRGLNGTLHDLIVYNSTLNSSQIYIIYNIYFNGCNKNLSKNDNYCILYQSTILNSNQNKNFNGSNSAAIYVQDNNINFDCQGSRIYGNNSDSVSDTNSRGINFQSGYQNVTIKNCNIHNYHNCLRFDYSNNSLLQNLNLSSCYFAIDYEYSNHNNLTNINITGNNFTENSIGSIGIYSKNSINTTYNNLFIQSNNLSRANLYFDNGSYYTSVRNSNFFGKYIYLAPDSLNISISYSNFSDGDIDKGSIYTLDTSNVSISFNRFLGPNGGIWVKSSNNQYIFNNYFNNSAPRASCLRLNTGEDFAYIFNNIIDTCDVGIYLGGSAKYIFVRNNSISNSFLSGDSYEAGIFLEPKLSNILIDSNTISRFGTVGIGVKNATNVTIINNIIYGLVERENLGYHDFNEPQVGIGLYQSFKGFSGDQQATTLWNVTHWSRYSNRNVNISNNTFYNVSIKLQSVGTINLTQDINSNYNSFELPYFAGKHEFWMIENFKNISRVNTTFKIEYNAKVCSYSNCSLKYQIYNDKEIYSNLLQNYINLNFYEKTFQYVFLPNGTGLKDFSGNITDTLFLPQQSALLINNYTLSESRISSNGYYEGEPFTLTKSISSNTINYHITSNITNIIEVPINITFPYCNKLYGLTSVSITPKGMTKYNPSFECNSNNMYISNLTLNYSQDSNVLNVSGTYINNETFSLTTYETSTETFTLNLTYDNTIYSAVSSFLVYNGTNYSTVKSYYGSTVYFTTSIDIPLVSSSINKTFYWLVGLTNVSGTFYYNTTTSTQTVNPINLTICGSSPLDIPYINFTFADETTGASVNGTIVSGVLDYYLGTGSVYKELIYQNVTANPSYAFCFSPADKNINIQYSLSYGGTGYQTRVVNPVGTAYSNTTSNKVLYLLATSDGLYATFQIINLASQPLSGVSVNCNRLVGTETQTVAYGSSGDDGIVTLFLNPFFFHTCSFSKSGYDVYSTSFYPTQSSYTITLQSSSSSGGSSSSSSTGANSRVDYSKDITYTISPTSLTLLNNTYYLFNFSLNSGTWEIEEFGFVLTNGSYVIDSVNSYAGEGSVSLNKSTGDYDYIIMNYFWRINGSYVNSSRTWIIYNSDGTDWSLKNFSDDLKRYASSGMFGLNSFSLTLIIYLLIFISVGIMSYKFGITSPGAISVFVFGLVFFFDITLGLIPQIPNAVPHFVTIFTAIIMIGLVIREWTR